MLVSNERQSNLLRITKGTVANCSATSPGKGVIGTIQPMVKGKGVFTDIPVHQACGPSANYPHPLEGLLDIIISTPSCKCLITVLLHSSELFDTRFYSFLGLTASSIIFPHSPFSVPSPSCDSSNDNNGKNNPACPTDAAAVATVAASDPFLVPLKTMSHAISLVYRPCVIGEIFDRKATNSKCVKCQGAYYY